MLYNLGDVALSQRHTPKAKKYLTASLRLRQELGHHWDVVWCVEGFAAIAALEATLERAIQLWGAAAKLRENFAIPLPLLDRMRYDQRIANARNHVSELRFQAAWEAGQTLTLSQTIAYTLDEQKLKPSSELALVHHSYVVP
ncbi:MAG: hypothetical protein GFH25_541210n1 [Chloroflexi bacterium AL-N10]|nr:hypothetical protein [Chloroflexi bacterium AL-N1]NOK69574.1 hypothetical protein [Chloroflexi bacterium AL-N10]NOK72121.1 hypothetical protein [Chloroflexi bacterium AL-N5]